MCTDIAEEVAQTPHIPPATQAHWLLQAVPELGARVQLGPESHNLLPKAAWTPSQNQAQGCLWGQAPGHGHRQVQPSPLAGRSARSYTYTCPLAQNSLVGIPLQRCVKRPIMRSPVKAVL